MRVNVGQAKTDLSKLLAAVEAGQEVEIARDGTPVAKLVRVELDRPGARFLAGWGSHAGRGWIGEDFELGDEELEEIYADPVDPA